MQEAKTGSPENPQHHTPYKERYAVFAGLFLLGIAFSTWASRIPDIRTAAALTAATLGYVFMARGLGTIVMMPVVAISINRIGARKTALITAGILSLTLLPLAYMQGWVALGLILFMVGVGASGYNISINSLGSRLEIEAGTSYMARIHSWFGVGNLFGALAGTFATKAGVSVEHHFLGVTVLMVGIVFVLYKYLPHDSPQPDQKRSKFSWPHGGLIAIGIICFLAATVEASINNWVALFYTDYIAVEEGLAPIGYAVFAGALLGMRLIGDRLKNRFGARILLVSGSAVAAAGLVLALLAANIYIATIGFFLAGIGVSLNFPMVFSAAGREGAVALTSVASFGYVGGMVSQPIIGWIVEEFQMLGGFVFIATASLVISVLAWRARLLKG